MLSSMGEIQALVSDPLTAFVVGLIMAAIALTGRFSLTASRALFVIAWLVALFGLRNQHIAWSIVFTLVLYGVAIWAKPEALPRNFGKITPRRRLVFGGKSNVQARIDFGDSGTGLIHADGGGTLFNFFDKADLVVEIIRNQVMISTKVTDWHGNIVAEIVRNQWRAPPPNAWDRNYSKDAFEVKDARGCIVLQVRAMPECIQLQGEWWDTPVHGVRMVGLGPGNGGAMHIFGPKFRPENVPPIKPMFRYPSETNLGQLAG